MAATRMKTIAVEASPDLDRSGEVVTLSEDYVGRIICQTLVVNSGVRAELTVSAQEVFVHGEVSGTLMSNVVTVAPTGVVVGHIKARQVNLAGRVNGLIHARMLVCRNGSQVEGEVLVDRLERQPEACFTAYVSVGPNFSDRQDLLQRAEKRAFPDRPVVVPLKAQEAKAPPASVQSPPAPEPAVERIRSVASRIAEDRPVVPRKAVPPKEPAPAEAPTSSTPFLVKI